MSEQAESNVVELDELKLPTIEFGVTEAQIAEVAERYKDPDASTEEGYEHCKEGVKTLTAMRTAVETRRLDCKRPITKWIAEHLDGRAKLLTRQIRTAEGPVRTEKERVDEIKQAEARKIAEAEVARIDGIKANIEKISATAREQNPNDKAADYQQHITWLTELAITEEVFGEFVEDATTAKDAALYKLTQWHEQAVQREADDARRADERAEIDRKQKELDKQADEQKEEAKRIAKGIQAAADLQAEIDRKGREKADREQRDKDEAERQRIAKIQAAIDIKRTIPDRAENFARTSNSLGDLITAERNNKPDELIFQEFLPDAIEAWEQSIAALETMANDASIREEKERRDEEARLPDRDKLIRWCDALEAITEPEVLNDKAQKLLKRYSSDLSKLIVKLRSDTGKL